MNRIARFLATGAYIGHLSRAPGTLGSLEGVLIVLALRGREPLIYWLVLAAVIAVGLWASGATEKEYGVVDDQRIVIDEIAGFLLTMLLLQVTLQTVVLGFVLFRVYDIWKPVSRLEKIPGGMGIMADDLAAGIMANVTLRAIALVW